MATLTAKLTLTSSNVLTDTLNSTTTNTLIVTNPTEFSRKSIATGSAQSIIASNSAFSYVYLKVVSGANTTDWVQIKLGGDAKLKMRVGEFAFLPLYSSQTVQGEAFGGACVVEYGYWSIS